MVTFHLKRKNANSMPQIRNKLPYILITSTPNKQTKAPRKNNKSVQSLVPKYATTRNKRVKNILRNGKKLSVDNTEQLSHGSASEDTKASADVQQKQPLIGTSTVAVLPQNSLDLLSTLIKDTIDQKLRVSVDSVLMCVKSEIATLRSEMSGDNLEYRSVTPVNQSSLKVHSPSVATLSGPSRTVLYLKGLAHHNLQKTRHFFTTLGIPSQAVELISFMGGEIVELIVLESFKEDLLRRLEKVNVKLDPYFDPLTPKFFDTAMIEHLGIVGESEVQQADAARRAFVSRMDSMLQTLVKGRHGLRSFLRSLRKAVHEGTSTEQYFNLKPRPNHVPAVDTSMPSRAIGLPQIPEQQVQGSEPVVTETLSVESPAPIIRDLSVSRSSNGHARKRSRLEAEQSSTVNSSSWQARRPRSRS